MKLPAMRCTNKFKQDGGVGVTVIFHSADKQSMATLALDPEQAREYVVGTYYDFEASHQKKRSET